ncbi:MAG: hypothetical protein HY376_03970 [Candidatus Blackburnbacteria bacterium]|nr:hypothetical protein [Candidatus Blackburnbacteria bacterium]
MAPSAEAQLGKGLLVSSERRARPPILDQKIVEINVLPQARKIIDDIPGLAESIARRGQLEPVIIAWWSDPALCQGYIDLVNESRGTNVQLSDLITSTEKGETVWKVLISGHRRLEACKYLQNVGCSSCHEKYGRGGCYERHVPTAPDQELVDLSLEPVWRRQSVKAFSGRVDQKIKDASPRKPTMDMMDIFQEAKEQALARERRRRLDVVESDTTYGVNFHIEYVNKVLRVALRDQWGEKGFPLSRKQVLLAYRRLIRLEAQALPLFQEVLTEVETEEFKYTLATFAAGIEVLLKRETDPSSTNTQVDQVLSGLGLSTTLAQLQLA